MLPVSWDGSRSNGAKRPKGAVLTNTIALWLGLLIVAAIIADLALNGGSALIFLARKFLDLIEWVDFWN